MRAIRWARQFDCLLPTLLVLLWTGPAAASAQSIDGVLVDRDTNRPIPLGLVMLYTESGDSLSATVADERGRFSLASTAPGSFVLRAASLGYAEAAEGVFDVGVGASLSVEFRLAPAPLPIDQLVVSISRPALEHHLVRNGFVRRLQRGLGLFVTPYDIEQSSARTTESLLQGMPSVRVGTVVSRQGGVGLPSPHLGETVQIVGPDLSWCDPVVYVDGLRSHYDPSQGFTLTALAHIGDVEAIEVYRRAAEMPVEFSPGPVTRCGILVMWTKRGLAVDQLAQDRSAQIAYDVSAPSGSLPDAKKAGPPPREGELIRVQLNDARLAPGLSSPWEGTFRSATDEDLVGQEPLSGRALAIPLEAIEELQVSRPRGGLDA